MNRKLIAPIVAALLTSSLIAVGAGLGKIATAASATSIAVDGQMDEAYKASTVIVPETNNSGAVDNAADLSAKIHTVYDKEALYVFVEVSDDTVETSRSQSPWNDDSVEVYVDGGNEKAAAYDGNDTQFVFSVNKKSFASTKERLDGVDQKFVLGDKGYTAEIKIPWANVGVTGVAAGKKIGFEVELNDDDDGVDRDGKLAWNADKDQCWTDPSYFGVLELK
jgi:Carbohydrate family 9 binding domain-like